MVTCLERGADCLHIIIIIIINRFVQRRKVLTSEGPADANAIPKPHHLLPHLNPDWFYLSGTGSPG